MKQAMSTLIFRKLNFVQGSVKSNLKRFRVSNHFEISKKGGILIPPFANV
jgi:hypothetical protein